MLNLYEIEDGETHKYIARNKTEAVLTHAETHGFTLKEYDNDHEGYEINRVTHSTLVQVNYNEWDRKCPPVVLSARQWIAVLNRCIPDNRGLFLSSTVW